MHHNILFNYLLVNFYCIEHRKNINYNSFVFLAVRFDNSKIFILNFVDDEQLIKYCFTTLCFNMIVGKIFIVSFTMMRLYFYQVDSTSSFVKGIAVKTSDCWRCGMNFGKLSLTVQIWTY